MRGKLQKSWCRFEVLSFTNTASTPSESQSCCLSQHGFTMILCFHSVAEFGSSPVVQQHKWNGGGLYLIKNLNQKESKKEISKDYQKQFQWCSSFHYSHSFLYFHFFKFYSFHYLFVHFYHLIFIFIHFHLPPVSRLLLSPQMAMQGIILKVSLLLYLLQDLRLAAVCKGNGEVEGLHRGWGSPAPQACMGLKGQPLLWDSSVPWCSRAAPWLSPLPNHEQKKKKAVLRLFSGSVLKCLIEGPSRCAVAFCTRKPGPRNMSQCFPGVQVNLSYD